MPITCHPSSRQSLSLAAISQIPHPASLLCQRTMECQPCHMPTAGAGSSQDTGCWCHQVWAEGWAPKAEHSGEHRKKLPPPPVLERLPAGSATPGLLFSVHFPACQVPSLAAEVAASRESRWLPGWIQTREARAQGGQPECVRLPLHHPVPPGMSSPHRRCAGPNPALPPQPGSRKEQSHPGCKKGEAQRGS